eukprot:GHVQ01004749.1.p1 GENE.GHVQ01004749.1~~GHVQ01004749.1.p1  ORF type:complete len:288 (-),score=36.13 GHVQ01004749.1:1409-2272(-)
MQMKSSAQETSSSSSVVILSNIEVYDRIVESHRFMTQAVLTSSCKDVSLRYPREVTESVKKTVACMCETSADRVTASLLPAYFQKILSTGPVPEAEPISFSNLPPIPSVRSSFISTNVAYYQSLSASYGFNPIASTCAVKRRMFQTVEKGEGTEKLHEWMEYTAEEQWLNSSVLAFIEKANGAIMLHSMKRFVRDVLLESQKRRALPVVVSAHARAAQMVDDITEMNGESKLSEMEVLNLLNVCPPARGTLVDLYCCIENCADRFSEEQVAHLQQLLHKHLYNLSDD